MAQLLRSAAWRWLWLTPSAVFALMFTVACLQMDISFKPSSFEAKTALERELQATINQAFQALKAAILET